MASAIFVLAAMASPAASGAPKPDYRDAVVRIEIEDPSSGLTTFGSGFFVSPHGELITNFHVMRGLIEAPAGKRATFSLRSGKRYSKFQVGQCSERAGIDLCYLKLAAFPDRWFSVRERPPGDGSRVLIVANTPDTFYEPHEGKLVGIFPFENIGQVQVSVPFRPGMSGSPIFSPDGGLVGVVTQSLDDRPDRRYLGISTRDVLRVIDGSPAFRDFPAR